jgi:hypothetical protein
LEIDKTRLKILIGVVGLWLLVLVQKPTQSTAYASLSDSIYHNLSPLSSSVSSLFSNDIEPLDREKSRYPDLDEIMEMLSNGPQHYMKYSQIIVRAATLYDMDPDLLRAVILVESRFNPNAESGKGAGGLMQLMPGTAKEMGATNVFNPAQNIYAGTKYLKRMLDMFDGNVRLALAGYNAGPGAVQKHGGIPPFRETRDYVKKVLTSFHLIKKRYGKVTRAGL